MDEPFLSKEEGTSALQPIKRDFPPPCLDLGPPKRQSTNRLITNDTIIPIITTPKTPSYANLIANLNKKKLTRRSHSAPSVLSEVKETFTDSLDPRPPPKSTPLIVKQAFFGLIIYIILGIVVFLVSGKYKGTVTSKPVDALYFMVVTLCTIGQEAVLLSTVDENRFNAMVTTYMIDKEKGRMRIRIKVCLALIVVVSCIAIGTVTVHFLEKLSWVDSFYLSVTSVTTVGYGDFAFTTLTGRCFAIVWLLVSTLAVARAFLYLAEFRIDKRNRRIAKWVLQKKMTLGDLVAADLDNDGSISKSEFVIYKLKEMGKIAEKDIMQICNQFDMIDSGKCGKITLADLMESD
ncbi:two pore potassium channel c-like isoform X2 [Mangifera indica]|uniref:two pore potassium channel c-like isoform X2 n=1 Tax=Mangifera indica TaxID=29780 RepID=UPI001CFA89B0|nr:two pore potassium channel c-like isoform X2 [Mangifera indica]